MSLPTIYKWTDPGAPTMVRNNMPEYMGVIQACLVDGYGAKAAPGTGWTIPFSDATQFVLKQGGVTQAENACIRFHTITTVGVLYETALDYTAINTPVDVFSIGNNYFPTGATNNATRQIPWVIIATDRSFWFYGGYNTTSSGADISNAFNTAEIGTDYSTSRCYHGFFGDYISYGSNTLNQVVIAGNTSSASTGSSLNSATFRCPGILGVKTVSPTVRLLSMDIIGESGYNSNTLDITQPTFPNGGDLITSKVLLMANRIIIGEVPGLIFPLHKGGVMSHGDINEFDGIGSYTGNKMFWFIGNNFQWIIHTSDWDTG